VDLNVKKNALSLQTNGFQIEANACRNIFCDFDLERNVDMATESKF
jgi:hypothetical protein